MRILDFAGVTVLGRFHPLLSVRLTSAYKGLSVADAVLQQTTSSFNNGMKSRLHVICPYALGVIRMT